MGFLFSNVAKTTLLSDLAFTETDQIVVSSKVGFPSISVGDRLRLTLIGACTDNVEIIDVNADCGANCWEIDARGLEGTTPANFQEGDSVVLQLTAEVVDSMYQGWRWYIGAFPADPTTDAFGDPLIVGMNYFNTVSSEVLVWNGSFWVPFSPLVGISNFAEYTWVFPSGHTAATPLPANDVYGTSMLDLSYDDHIVMVYLNGSKLVEEVDAGVLTADFTVDYSLNQITLTNAVPNDGVVQAIIGQRSVLQVSGGGIDYTNTTLKTEWLSANTIGVQPGRIKAANTNNIIEFTSAFTKTVGAAPWVAGDGNQGVPTTSGLVHRGIFAIQDPINDLQDLCISHFWDASDRPAAYTDYKLIGFTQGPGGDLRKFIHIGNRIVCTDADPIVQSATGVVNGSHLDYTWVYSALNLPNFVEADISIYTPFSMTPNASAGTVLALLVGANSGDAVPNIYIDTAVVDSGPSDIVYAGVIRIPIINTILNGRMENGSAESLAIYTRLSAFYLTDDIS